MKYCYHCGSIMDEVWTGKYNEDDGTKIMKHVCPKEPCRHSGDHVWVRPEKFWQWLFLYDYKCSRCGETISYSGC